MRSGLKFVVFASLALGPLSGVLVAAQSETVEPKVQAAKKPASKTEDKKKAKPQTATVAPDRRVKTQKEAPPPRAIPSPPRIFTDTPPPPAPPVRPRSRRKRNSEFDMLVSDDGLSVHAVGTFDSGFSREFKKAIEDNPDLRTVILSSDGGLVVEGIAVAKLIEKHGLNTHVEIVCASSCTMAFLAGKRKTIAKSGRLGFHQAHKGSLNKPVETSLEKRNSASWALANFYREAGLDGAIIEKALATSPKDFWYPQLKALFKNLKGSKIVDDGATDFATGSWSSAQSLRNILDSDPTWQMMAKVKPVKYLNSVSRIWTDGILKEDRDSVIESVQDSLVEILFADLAKYPDDIVDTALQLQNDVWQLKDDRRNRKCVSIGNRRVPSLRPATFSHKERRDALLKEMISQNIDPEPLSDAEKNKSYAIAIDFWGLMVSETETTTFRVVREFCSKPKRYFEELSKLPADERIAIYRALMTSEARSRFW